MSLPQCFAPKRNVPDPESIISYTGAFPCTLPSNGGAVSCCRGGDTCLEGNICQFSSPPSSDRLYYVAGCSDSSFQDPNCNRHCLSSAWPEITYLNSSASFGCCLGPLGSVSPDCSQPTSESWKAPAPADLKTIAAIPSTPPAGWEPSSATATATSASGSAAAATPEATIATATPSASSSSGGLDTGAKIGIGVGIGVGVVLIALLAGILWVLSRRRRRAATPPGDALGTTAAAAPYSPHGPHEKSLPPPPDFYGPSEKPADAPPNYQYRPELPPNQLHEISTLQSPTELPVDTGLQFPASGSRQSQGDNRGQSRGDNRWQRHPGHFN